MFYDGGVLSIPPNISGGAFLDVTDPAVGGSFVTGGYNGMISVSTGSPIAGRQGVDWRFRAATSTPVLGRLRDRTLDGQTIRLRFRMASDDIGGGVGWRIDTVTSVGACVAGTAPTPTPAPTATMFPTPFPEPAVQFAITAPAQWDVNVPLSFGVIAQDKFGNTDPNYAGTVHFPAVAPPRQLPADSPLANGTGIFSATFYIAGSWAITATDTLTRFHHWDEQSDQHHERAATSNGNATTNTESHPLAFPTPTAQTINLDSDASSDW